MTITEFLKELCQLNQPALRECDCKDGVKFGNPDRELTCVGVTMCATVSVIRRAVALGAQLLIVHEPTFYHDLEEIHADDAVFTGKKKLLDDSGLVVFRYHDHPHCMADDLIDVGTIRELGLKGRVTGKPYFAVTRFVLDEPMTARALAETIRTTTPTNRVNIAGDPEAPVKNIAFACGTPGNIFECLNSPEYDCVVTGEIGELAQGAYANDMAALGIRKALLVAGHIGSEKAGMKYLSEILSERYPALSIHYLDDAPLYCD